MRDDYLDVNWDDVLRYDPETITIPAGGYLEIPGVASFVGFLSVTGSDNLQISFNNRNYQPLEVGLLIKAPRNKGFRRLFVKNPGASANTVKISKGLGDFDDNRLVLSSSSLVPVSLQPQTGFNGNNYIGGFSAAGSSNVITAASNVNGVIISWSRASGYLTAVSSGYNFYLGGAVTNVHQYMRHFNGATGTVNQVEECARDTPVFFPAGQNIIASVSGSGTFFMSYSFIATVL